MPLVGSNPDASSRAHARYAGRYARSGHMPKAAAHFGRALKYASGFGMNEGTKSASVSSVSASLADMDLGGGERRGEKRQRSQDDDGEVTRGSTVNTWSLLQYTPRAMTPAMMA
jgi:hypothetical protein